MIWHQAVSQNLNIKLSFIPRNKAKIILIIINSYKGFIQFWIFTGSQFYPVFLINIFIFQKNFSGLEGHSKCCLQSNKCLSQVKANCDEVRIIFLVFINYKKARNNAGF